MSETKEPIDDLFDEAVMVALAMENVKTLDLQRNLGIGYCRASRIMEQLKDLGVAE
jgi:DNA segregation ATPase FtsK/SpoIIIE-like protein